MRKRKNWGGSRYPTSEVDGEAKRVNKFQTRRMGSGRQFCHERAKILVHRVEAFAGREALKVRGVQREARCA
jgi:hypothetical protein